MMIIILMNLKACLRNNDINDDDNEVDMFS